MFVKHSLDSMDVICELSYENKFVGLRLSSQGFASLTEFDIFDVFDYFTPVCILFVFVCALVCISFC